MGFSCNFSKLIINEFVFKIYICFFIFELIINNFKQQSERQDAVIERLVSLFGGEARSSLIHYTDIDWSQEHYVGGCPVGVGQTGALYQHHEGIRTPFDRLVVHK